MMLKYAPQELAQMILDQVRMHPETHYQGEWEVQRPEGERWAPYGQADKNFCGTTRCVAGWAQYFTYGFVNLAQGHLEGQHLLGLDEYDADALFYGTLEEEAIHALEYLAKGENIDWHAVKGWSKG